MIDVGNPYKSPAEENIRASNLERKGILKPEEAKRLSLVLSQLDQTYFHYLAAENETQKINLRTRLTQLLGENLTDIVSRLIDNEVSSVDLDDQSPDPFSLLIMAKPNIQGGTNVLFRVKARKPMPPAELIEKMFLRLDLREKGKIKEGLTENMYLDPEGWFRGLIKALLRFPV